MKNIILFSGLLAVLPLVAAGAPQPEGKGAAPVAAENRAGMVLIPAGEFTIGSSRKDFLNESPRHKVYLDAFYIDKYEVTGSSYAAFAKAAGREVPKPRYGNPAIYPAVYMTWDDAKAYCEAQGKALPTEAQWEKAAGGGTEGAFGFGDDAASLREYGWFWGNSGQKLHPVGRLKPNAYGVYDMHGNAQEWVADWYADNYYSVAPSSNPAGPDSGEQKVIKGGSAFVTADLCRSATRLRSSPQTRYSVKGFRCAAAAPAAQKIP